MLRFENLGSDPGADWMGRAFADILTTEMARSPEVEPISANRLHAFNQTFGARPVSAPGLSAERTLAMAAGATRIAYGTYSDRAGRLETQVTVEDARTGKVLEVAGASSPAGDVLSSATALARQLSRQVAPYGTSSNPAMKAWTTAVESSDANAITKSLETAIEADPDFGPPYRLLAQLKAQQQDRAAGIALLQQATARGEKLSPVERARISLELANLRDDAAGREKALAELVKLDPRDSSVSRAQGDAALIRRDYKLAIQAFQKSVETEPENFASWNQLGYAQAYAGDLNAAITALKRYQALRPNDPDPVDSQGDANLLLGNLREAEDLYLQAAKKSPGYPNAPDLFKAAMARLMTGDVPGADAILKQYADARAASKDATVPIYLAEWHWISGRRKPAYQELRAFADGAGNGPLKELASRSYAELAIWSLLLGDRAGSDEMVKRAIPLATQNSAALIILARFLGLPPASTAEWMDRGAKQFPNPNQEGLKLTWVAYALLLNKDFQGAAPILQQIYQRNGPAGDETSRIPLAWCLLETGKPQGVSSLLKLLPIPPLTGPNPLLAFYFPRYFYLRGLDAEKAGRADDARTNYRLFTQISGTDPLVWGEESKAH